MRLFQFTFLLKTQPPLFQHFRSPLPTFIANNTEYWVDLEGKGRVGTTGEIQNASIHFNFHCSKIPDPEVRPSSIYMLH